MLKRYRPHLLLSGFGLEEQKKLHSAKVLVIGAGGLGCPLLLYLTAAGVGTIGIVDSDSVEESNLQRQILYTEADLGKLKVDVARKRLSLLNSKTEFVLYPHRFTVQNALEIIKPYDVICDGTDNFQTRYMINDACVLLNKPDVYASIFQFEGQVTVFNYVNKEGVRGPHYRDLFPVFPPQDLLPNCEAAGVLGVLPGIMGTIQANEVIKIITGIGEVLSGRLLTMNTLNFETHILTLPNAKGGQTMVTKLEENPQASCCEIGKGKKEVPEVTVQELKAKRDHHENFQLIDVREKNEYEFVNIQGDLIPLGELERSLSKISKEKTVIVHCRSGGRSSQAVKLLREKFGYTNVYNLKGGILAYIDEIDPSLPKY